MHDRIFSETAQITGGAWDAHVTTDGNFIDADIRNPKQVGGSGGGTNPAQLMAAAYGACFHSMLVKELAQHGHRDVTPPNVEVEAEMQTDTDGGFRVAFNLKATLHGVEENEVDEIIENAHKGCPFSKAIDGGNTEVTIDAKVAA